MNCSLLYEQKNKTLIKISYSKEEKNSYNFCNHLHIFETHETHYPNKKTINIQIYIFLANLHSNIKNVNNSM